MRERDDTELVRAAQAGDRSALDQLLRAHVDRLHALCRRLCSDRSDAEDATQEALLAVVRGLPRFDGRSSFTTWSHRVATNTCLDALRRQRRRPTVIRSIGPRDDESDRGTTPFGPLDPVDPAAGPDIRIPQRMAIDDALGSIPEEFRVPVVLRDQMGLDYAEIAEVLGIPPGTVRSRIARGRARLAELLHPDDGNPSADDDVQGTRP
ncbi:MAG TPA: RNA polymerase sigma factor [Acidimicrobiales bacterium]